MRLWTLHPKYLDAQGLVALWREALLAQAVLRGRTLGYRNHPQLHRFRDHDRPRSAINAFLAEVHDESSRRGYSFDRAKVGPVRAPCQLIATSGQIEHEWNHLLRKLHSRDREAYRRWCKLGQPEPNPLFMIVTGPVAPWERLP